MSKVGRPGVGQEHPDGDAAPELNSTAAAGKLSWSGCRPHCGDEFHPVPFTGRVCSSLPAFCAVGALQTGASVGMQE